jgi:hypothetical protein
VIFADDRYEPNSPPSGLPPAREPRLPRLRWWRHRPDPGLRPLRRPGAGALLLRRGDRGRARGQPVVLRRLDDLQAAGTPARPVRRQELRGKKVGAIVTQTPNFNDAVEGWERRRQQAGLPYTETLRHPKGNTSWYSGYAQQLHDGHRGGLHPPARSTTSASRRSPTTPATTSSTSASGSPRASTTSCGPAAPRSTAGSSSRPSLLDVADKLDPSSSRRPEVRRQGDDIAWALWGIAKLQHELFKRYEQTFGNDLTREDFRALTRPPARSRPACTPTCSTARRTTSAAGGPRARGRLRVQDLQGRRHLQVGLLSGPTQPLARRPGRSDGGGHDTGRRR